MGDGDMGVMGPMGAIKVGGLSWQLSFADAELDVEDLWNLYGYLRVGLNYFAALG